MTPAAPTAQQTYAQQARAPGRSRAPGPGNRGIR